MTHLNTFLLLVVLAAQFWTLDKVNPIDKGRLYRVELWDCHVAASVLEGNGDGFNDITRLRAAVRIREMMMRLRPHATFRDE